MRTYIYTYMYTYVSIGVYGIYICSGDNMICNTEVAKANNAFVASRRVQFAGGRRLSCVRARAVEL